MLMGYFENSIDSKNRLIVPAKFREELGFKFIVSKGLDQCLIIYPMATWEKQQEKLSKLPWSDESARDFLRYTYQSAIDCEMDKQGRTVLPQYLRDYAQIDRETVTIGMLDRIEVWSKSVYDNDPHGGKLKASDLTQVGQKYQV